MKKILFLAVILSALMIIESCKQQKNPDGQIKITIEQDENAREKRVEQIIERLNKELKLTDKQQSELKTYFTESFKNREINFLKNRKDPGQMYKQIKKEQEETNKQLQQILTEEQYNTYKENEKKRRQRGREHYLPHNNKNPR